VCELPGSAEKFVLLNNPPAPPAPKIFAPPPPPATTKYSSSTLTIGQVVEFCACITSLERQIPIAAVDVLVAALAAIIEPLYLLDIR
jgi:hypothetical protein